MTDRLWHSDDSAVTRFSKAMRDKLADCRERGRGGWDNPLECSTDRLKVLLFNQMAKEPADVVDIANLCMMLHQRGVTHV